MHIVLRVNKGQESSIHSISASILLFKGLKRLAEQFKAHLEAKKNPLMAAVKFDRRRQQPGESFDSFVTDLKLLARGLDITEADRLIRNAIACKSLDDRVRQRCLEKSKNLTLNTAIDIGRMFKATKDGMQVMAREDPRVEVNALADIKGQPTGEENQSNRTEERAVGNPN